MYNKWTKEWFINIGILKYAKGNGNLRVIKSNISAEDMNELIELTSNCRDNLSERIYWILNDITEYPLCETCGKQVVSKFGGFKRGYITSRFCSRICIRNNEVTVEKIKRTSKEKYGTDWPIEATAIRDRIKDILVIKYGVDNSFKSIEIMENVRLARLKQTGYEHASQNPKVRQNILRTNIERYGVDNPRKADTIKDKIKRTNQERYGYDYFLISPEGQKQRVQTTLDTYGVEYALQSSVIKKKIKQTNLDRYGVEYPAQNTEVFEKCNKYKNKQMILPSGRVIQYQGYEKVAIIRLLLDYNEDNIKNQRGEVPSIWYTDNEVLRRYYPDIYIPSENLIVEVKSTWTYKKHFDINQLKKKACIEQGYNFQFWICSNKKLLQII